MLVDNNLSFPQETFVDHPDTVLVREVLGRRPEDDDSQGDEDVGDESESEDDVALHYVKPRDRKDDMEGESGEEDSDGGGTLSTQNPFAVLDDSS